MHHYVKMYWESGGTAPYINLSTRCMWMVSYMPKLLYPLGESPQYPLDRRMGRPRTGLDEVARRKIPCPY